MAMMMMIIWLWGKYPKTESRGLLASDMQSNMGRNNALYYRSWMIDFMCDHIWVPGRNTNKNRGPNNMFGLCRSNHYGQPANWLANRDGARAIFCKVIRRQLRNIYSLIDEPRNVMESLEGFMAVGLEIE